MQLNPKFLLIEDNLIDQLVIKQLFKKILLVDDLHVANNGREGMEWLDINQNNFHSLVIILDIQMPVMNGFEFLNAFGRLYSEDKKDIEIYVLSSTLDANDISQIKESNDVTGFLGKPFPIEEFRKKIPEH
jgi:CheY-like chemotaxis protein